MDYQLLLIFTGLNVANVIIQTVKSITTVKCGKVVASLTNAIAYGLYTIVTVYMLCDLPLLSKAGIVAICNLIGVFIVKFIEEKLRKDKLWKIEVTAPAFQAQEILMDCETNELTYNYININKYVLFNFYAPTQKDTAKIKTMLEKYAVKYFINETKTL